MTDASRVNRRGMREAAGRRSDRRRTYAVGVKARHAVVLVEQTDGGGCKVDLDQVFHILRSCAVADAALHNHYSPSDP